MNWSTVRGGATRWGAAELARARRLVAGVAFWATAAFPVLYLVAYWAYAVVGVTWTAFVGLVVVNLVVAWLGSSHEPSRARDPATPSRGRHVEGRTHE